MQLVYVAILDDGAFFSPGISQEQFPSPEVFSSESLYPVVAVDEAVSGQPVLVYDFEFSELYSIYAATDRNIETNFISDGQIFSPLITSAVISTSSLDFGQMYDISVSSGFSPSYFDNSSVFSVIVSNQDEISTNLINSGQMYSISVESAAVEVDTSPFDNSFVFPIIALSRRVAPLRMKLAESPYGGDITSNFFAPSQDYYNKVATDYESRTDFIFSQSQLMDRYIASNEALFSQTFYRAFYIQNDSTISDRLDVDFWIDGGSSYTIDSKRISENRFFLEEEEDKYGALLENRDEILLNGRSRTSMFGQIDVSYYISPTKALYRFSSSGVGVGIDLTRQRFTPGYQSTRIPKIGPKEYYGVYLKVVTKFLPDFPIKSDYSFFHLSYRNSQTGFRETYPGQVKDGNVGTSLLLPSVYMKVDTSYEAFKRELDYDVEKIYSRYPPYFTPLEDVVDE